MLVILSIGMESDLLPPSNIICKKLTINRENSGILPKRHQIRVPQIDSIGVDVKH